MTAKLQMAVSNQVSSMQNNNDVLYSFLFNNVPLGHLSLTFLSLKVNRMLAQIAGRKLLMNRSKELHLTNFCCKKLSSLT